jgi:CheY-like chemotaxis protein
MMDDKKLNTIAVVEDNEDSAVLLQALLEDSYKVIVYNTGGAALTGFEKCIPDIVLLDISLPDIDGIEVLKQIRKNDRLKHLQVVALTAHAMKGDETSFLLKGFDKYLSKPILDGQVLLDMIHNLLQEKTND